MLLAFKTREKSNIATGVTLQSSIEISSFPPSLFGFYPQHRPIVTISEYYYALRDNAVIFSLRRRKLHLERQVSICQM